MKPAALAYAARGWSVIPVGQDKRPRLPWAPYQTRRAPGDEIDAWFARWPDTSISVVTGEISGLLVVDVDAADPKRFATACAKLAELLPETPTPCARTRRGGLHYYFARPVGGLSNRAHVGGFDIDVRCDGGYVVVAPSPGYLWITTPEEVAPGPAPDALLAFLRPPKVQAPPATRLRVDDNLAERARRYVARMDPAISGSGGHAATFKVACSLVHGFALDEGAAWSILCEYNQRCSPPWNEKELRHKLESAASTPTHELPRGHLADTPSPHVRPPEREAPPPRTDDEYEEPAPSNVEPSTEKPPPEEPRSPDAEPEEAALACLLDRPSDIHAVEIRIDDFGTNAIRVAYQALHSLVFDRGGHIDLVTLSAEIRRLGHAAPTMDDLAAIQARPHAAAGLVDYAAKLREAANRRHVAAALEAAQRQLASGTDAALAVLEGTVKHVVAASDMTAEFVEPAALTAQVLAGMRDEIGEELLPTSIPSLDQAIGGFPIGHLTMIGGRPSHGKSLLSRCIMANMAAAGISSLFISLEDSKVRLARWLMVRVAGVPDILHRLRARQLAPGDDAAMVRAAGLVNALPFVTCEEASLTVEQVCQRTRQAVARKQVKIVWLDYLNLLELPRRRERRDEELTDAVQKLVRLAKATGIAVVALAQLSRGNEKEKRHPELTDFKDCGGIEEAAELALLVHRPWRFKQDMLRRRTVKLMEVVVAKGKEVDVARVPLYVEGGIGDVREPEPDYFLDGNINRPLYDTREDAHPDGVDDYERPRREQGTLWRPTPGHPYAD